MQEAAPSVDTGTENPFGGFDFERPFEAANENEPLSAEIIGEISTPENLGDGRGGDKDAEKPLYANDNAYQFTGSELVDATGMSFTKQIEATGDPEAISLHCEMIRQWNEARILNLEHGREFFNPDKKIAEADGDTIYKTRMWLGADGQTVGFDIRSIKAPANDNEAAEVREWGWAGATDLVAEMPAFNDKEKSNASEGILLHMEHAAVAEIEDSEDADGDEDVSVPTEIHPEVHPVAEYVSHEKPGAAPVENTGHAPAQAPTAREVRASELNSFLAVEQLPGIREMSRLAEPSEIIVLKAPVRTESTTPAQPIRISEAQEIARESSDITLIESMTRTVLAVEHARVPTPIETRTIAHEIVRDEQGPEMIEEAGTPAQRVIPLAEQPIMAPQKVDVRNADLPVHVFANETRLSKIQDSDQKEIRAEVPKIQKPKAAEEFRRGRRRARYEEEASSKARHDDHSEAVEKAPRSVAEATVVKMVERFGPETHDDREDQADPETADTPIAKVDAIDHKGPEIQEPENRNESPVADTAPVLTTISPEVSQTMGTKPRDIEGSNVIPFREFSRTERNTHAEIDEVLRGHGLTRLSTVETGSPAPGEIAKGISQRAYVAAVSDDSHGGVIASRGGVRMIKLAA